MSYNEIICEVNNELEIYYETYDRYQGEWLLITFTQEWSDNKYNEFKMYKDYYGSCSGCDAYEATFDSYDGHEEHTIEEKKKFVDNYKPFCIIPYENMKNLILDGALKCIMPLNIDYCDTSIEVETQKVLDAIRKKFPEWGIYNERK